MPRKKKGTPKAKPTVQPTGLARIMFEIHGGDRCKKRHIETDNKYVCQKADGSFEEHRVLQEDTGPGGEKRGIAVLFGDLPQWDDQQLAAGLRRIVRDLDVYGDNGSGEVKSLAQARERWKRIADCVKHAEEILTKLPTSPKLVELKTHLGLVEEYLTQVTGGAERFIEEAESADDEQQAISVFRRVLRQAHDAIGSRLLEHAAKVVKMEQEETAGAGGDGPKGEWSRPLSKEKIADALDISTIVLETGIRGGVYVLRSAGNRQSWQINLAGLPKERRERLA